jgi:branched-chain amino acid transport system permease protein
LTSVASPVAFQRRVPFGVRLLASGGIGIAIYWTVLAVFATGGTAAATQQVANALTLGAIYALVALGYTMVYGIIELINFAHGDVFMVGAFIALTFMGTGLGMEEAFGFAIALVGAILLGLGMGLLISRGFLRSNRGASIGVTALCVAVAIGMERGLGLTANITNPFVLAGTLVIILAVCMISMGSLNIGIERFAYRPLRHAPRLAPLITAIGVSFILQNVVQIWQGTGDRVPSPIFPNAQFELFGASIRVIAVVIIIVAIVLMYSLQTFVSRTRLGRAMRSTAQDQQAAQLMGVDLNLTIAATFLLGGALAGAAGLFQCLYFGFVRSDIGFNAGLKAFTAAVLGGIGNLTGAAIGGFIIGFIEVAATALGYTQWSQAIVFVVLIVVLVFRPAGILGQQVGERA